jgi:two-component system response regulator HydG
MIPATLHARRLPPRQSADNAAAASLAPAGTPFGCAVRAHPEEAAMTGSAQPEEAGRQAFAPRQRERRAALSELLTALTHALGETRDVSLLRGIFEEGVRRAMPVRSVHLRDRTSRWGGRSDPGALESMALEVPCTGSGGVLEATFDPGCHLGEWDFQLLGITAHIAAFVLEIERARLQLARAGLLPAVRIRRDQAAPLLGSTPAIHTLRSQIARVAATDFTVLLEGESGVGKELVAHQIHDLSARRNGPFVALNCAAIVDTLLEAELFGIEERTATGVRGRRGKFEQADGGTLFLDEVSDLSLSAQAKVLRAIQDLSIERVGGAGSHRVDVRIVAATNRGLAGLVDRKEFRADLFYRLAGVDLRVPSLRERRGDILELARHFLDRHKARRPLHLSDAAADALVAYHWPGNVRELERLIERTVAMANGDTIEIEDLPVSVHQRFAEVLLPSLERKETMRAWAARYARAMLQRCGGNKRVTSEALGISYHTLNAYLKQADAIAAALDDDPPLAGACVTEV